MNRLFVQLLRPASALVCGLIALILIGCDSPRSRRDSDLAKPPSSPPADTASSNPASREANVASSAEPLVPPLDGHQRMVRLLADIATHASEVNPYLGDAEARKLQTEFDHRQPGNLPEEIRIRTALGFQLLRLGRNEQAIEHLEAAVQLVTQGLVSSTEQSAEGIVLLAAMAWLRKAEVENCLNSSAPETCLFPVPVNGIHARPEAARQSMRYLRMLLERRPENRTAQWLLNVAAMTVGEYPDGIPQFLRIPVSGFDGTAPLSRFENVAQEAGVDVRSLSGGLIAEDFNNDGWIDLMVSDCHPAGQLRLFQKQVWADSRTSRKWLVSAGSPAV